MDKPEPSKMNVETDLPNFPSGPLDQYRARASFDWKRMKLFIEDERLLKFKMLNFQTSVNRKPVDPHPPMSHPGIPVDHPPMSHPGIPVDHPPMSHPGIPVAHPTMSHPGMPVDHPLTSHPGMPLDVWKKMESDGPLFQHPSNTPTLDEYRRLTTLRVNRIRDYNFVPLDVAIEDPIKPLTLIILLYEYDASLSLKYAIPFGFFFNALLALGQPKHLEFLDAANKEEISGCYALTEVAHGTNAKKMQTTATFDVKTQQFILHSAGFEAAKCWAGSLGERLSKAATHGTVFAQLVTPDGVCHGLHAFIVPLRDPNTLLVHPGIIIGDMGEKLGLNAVDNGFAIFNQYRIPKDNLLNKIGSVTPSGQYVSPVKDSRKRFGASLGALTVGRVVINCISTVNLSKAVTIAVRYSAVRKQFGPTEDGEELPVIEYQLQAKRNTVHTTLLSLDGEEHISHYTAVTRQGGTLQSLDREEHSSHYTDQWRLFPYIAAAFALKVYSEYSLKILVEFNIALMLNKRSDHMNNLGAEIHALQSSAKPLCSWTAQHGIQECREACGGHGYLSYSRRPRYSIFYVGCPILRAAPQSIMEGKGRFGICVLNDVVMHQSGPRKVHCTSLVTVDLHPGGHDKQLACGKVQDMSSGFGKLRDDNDANCTYEGDNNVLCQQTSNWLLQIWSQARDTRVGDISPLGSIGFLQRATVGELLARRFTAQTLEQAAHPEEILSAYGWLVTWLLEGTHALHQAQLREGKDPFVARNSSQVFHARTLSLAYIERFVILTFWNKVKGEDVPPELRRGYAVGPAMSRFVKRGILSLCSELKSESVALVDVLAPPDFILNSALGHSDGQVYKNLQLHMYQSPGVMSRPSWWKEMSGLHRSRL
uniref:Acyl-coenzyme A oxidase n=1 Tax=Timema genevievae TaxID=629358 RepID=A0A7R9PQF5_TIMGE|nr:unnamed protein product [Timema genevievae]